MGRWTLAVDCSGGTTFLSDGTYTLGNGRGRWSLSGSTLTLHLEQEPTDVHPAGQLGGGGVANVRIDGPDEMLVDYGDVVGGHSYVFVFRRCG